MKTFLIIDAANLFFRARHAINPKADLWDKLGFAMHVTLNSVASCWRDHRADHVIFCFEGRSWRKDFYPPYKRNRAEARAAMSEQEQEEDRLFFAAFDDLKKFLIERSNCTVLQHERLEADDFIGGWCQNHPDDTNIIISTDTDFYQLISKNVKQYNGIEERLITHEGIFDKKGNPVLDKKTKEPLPAPDPEWLLFEKCMRGDKTDNIFSAYPGVREKGSKNKVGLREAFEDRNKRGFAWNNLMLQKWTDHNDEEHRVLTDYNRNRTLIDLQAQPDDIKRIINEVIQNQCVPQNKPMVGAYFLKFCAKYELKKISEFSDRYIDFLTASYPRGNNET
ncbi:MAG: hypothetical protein N2235_05350 [Fischerella sp.]|nr:hypothetical protein [Fischerella sp.]